MKGMQNIFYILGIIFLFLAVSYFSYEYVFRLTNLTKTIILLLLTTMFFYLADYMLERGI